MNYEDGEFYGGLGHWCAFCQCFHSSVSCFAPGRSQLEALKQQVAALVAALTAAGDRLHLFRALQGDTVSHWDVDDDNALDKVDTALAAVAGESATPTGVGSKQ